MSLYRISCRRAGYHVIPVFSERCLMCYSSREQCDNDADLVGTNNGHTPSDRNSIRIKRKDATQ